VTGVKHLRILLLVAIASPLLAFLPGLQDPGEWAKDVEKACTSQRYGLRLAAARKVAAGGAAAVPAIREFMQKNGPNAVTAALVEAIADQTTLEAVVLELLIAWAKNPDFYWRAQAMRGIAQRAPKLPGFAKELRAIFASYHDDPAWLMRTFARFGSMVLDGVAAVPGSPETDPRAVVKLATLLLAQGTVPPLQPLFEALADERTFLGDPWGSAMPRQRIRPSRAGSATHTRCPKAVRSPTSRPRSTSCSPPASAKSGQQLRTPAPALDPPGPFAGGIEILSCKSGDLFVRWTEDGVVHAGLDAALSVRLPADAWARLSQQRAQQLLEGNLGVVICDAMRLSWVEPKVHVKVAPASLPAATANWLLDLSQALDIAGQPRLAAALSTGLKQFAAP
jgi:hypothetical protein